MPALALDLVYEEFGSQGAPKTPLIILHGFLASSRNWRFVAEGLAENHHVYVLDLRNHGRSPHNATMDYPSMANDVEFFLQNHGIDKASLLGHSMGGKIAMWFALNYPDRLDKLIVADIAPITYQHNFDNTLNALKTLPLQEIKSRKQAEILLAETIPELSYRQFLLQNLELKDGEYCWRIDLAIISATAPNITAFPKTDGLVSYSGKGLFVVGRDSHFVKNEDIYPLFPHAELKIIPNAGHWLHVQQPASFIDVVTNFLLN
jgi:esterase